MYAIIAWIKKTKERDGTLHRFSFKLRSAMRKQCTLATHTKRWASPSPRGYAIGCSISAFSLNNTIIRETKLNIERIMARKAAMRGSEAIRIIAA
jgi:hypothetical protein